MLSLLNTKYHHVKTLLMTFHLSGNIIGLSFENSIVRTALVLRLSGGDGGRGGSLRDETKTAARETA